MVDNVVLFENNNVLKLVFNENEVTWKEVLLNLVKSNQLDPWDVDIKILTKEYIKIVKKLKEHDLKFSGKVILAAAILLKIKSERFLEEDISVFDNLMHSASEEEIEAFYNELENSDFSFEPSDDSFVESPSLIPRLPQLKKRRVSVYDLIDILEETLEKPVKKKVVVNSKKTNIKIPEVKFDMSRLILFLSEKLNSLFKKNSKIPFETLLSGSSKEDKILTFMPLLHLAHVDHRLVDLEQEKSFSQIFVVKAKK